MMFEVEYSNFEIWLIASFLFLIRYVLIACMFFLVFYVWKKKGFLSLKLQRGLPSWLQVKREIFYTVITFFIYGGSVCLFVYWTKHGMTKQYHSFEAYGIYYFAFSIVLMIVLHDSYFYWTHRLMHHKLLFKRVHKTHHSFHITTPSTAFAFHPFESIISMGIIPLIVFLIPYHQWALIIFVSIMILNNIIIHLGYRLPEYLTNGLQNTAVQHDLHHKGIKRNYGLYFNFWDKLMGTYQKD